MGRIERLVTQRTLMHAGVRNQFVMVQPGSGGKLSETDIALERVFRTLFTPVEFVMHLRVLPEGVFRRELCRTTAAFPTRTVLLDLVPLPGRITNTPFYTQILSIAKTKSLVVAQIRILGETPEAKFTLKWPLRIILYLCSEMLR